MAVRLFVGNLAYSTTEADLRAYFGTVAPPSQVVLPPTTPESDRADDAERDDPVGDTATGAPAGDPGSAGQESGGTTGAGVRDGQSYGSGTQWGGGVHHDGPGDDSGSSHDPYPSPEPDSYPDQHPDDSGPDHGGGDGAGLWTRGETMTAGLSRRIAASSARTASRSSVAGSGGAGSVGRIARTRPRATIAATTAPMPR